MELVDSRNNILEKGLTVRYIRTGTIGEISNIKNENEIGWVQLDENELWYDSSYVEIIEKREHKKEIKKEISHDEKLEKIKTQIKFDDVDMSSNSCEGGG